MTEKQIQKVKDKIVNIRKTLAAEKRKFGGYHDGRGLRYWRTALYLKIRDYNGGLIYLKWYKKNFSDDIGFPEFLFESTVILFMTGKFEEAESTAIRTYYSNTFIFDKYFLKKIVEEHKIANTNFNQADWIENFSYCHNQDYLLEFSAWLSTFIHSEKFTKRKEKFDNIEKQLETEPVGPKRTHLVNQRSLLIKEF